MFSNTFFQNNFIYFILTIFLTLLIIVILLILFVKKRKPKHVVDLKFVDDLLNAFGSNKNIKSINLDTNRLKVEVIDLKIVNLERIKELSNSGVFVTNNTIKALFSYNSDVLKKEIESRRRKND